MMRLPVVTVRCDLIVTASPCRNPVRKVLVVSWTDLSSLGRLHDTVIRRHGSTGAIRVSILVHIAEHVSGLMSRRAAGVGDEPVEHICTALPGMDLNGMVLARGNPLDIQGDTVLVASATTSALTDTEAIRPCLFDSLFPCSLGCLKLLLGDVSVWL